MFGTEPPPKADPPLEERNLKRRDVFPPAMAGGLYMIKSVSLICMYEYGLFTINVKFINNPV